MKQMFTVFLCLLSFGVVWAQDVEYEAHEVYLKFYDSELEHSKAYVKSMLLEQGFNVEVDQAFKTKDHSLNRIFHVYLYEDTDPFFFIEKVSELKGVEYAERIAKHQFLYTPNDLQTNQYNLDLIEAKKAWDLTKGDTNVVVAVVDDAVLISHEDLQANIWRNKKEIPNNNIDDDNNGWVDDVFGYDLADKDNDPNPVSKANSNFHAHGTHCAGIVSARTNNSKGIASIGFGLKIMPVKIGYETTNCGFSPTCIRIRNAYQGVDYAIKNKANVISMSWGRGGGASKTEQLLINVAYNRNIVCVAAAGNSNLNQAFYPASYQHVISVASTDAKDKKSSFSTYHSTVDVCAPGSSINSCVPGSSKYGMKSGTSMACPLVAGLCGLMISVDPTITVSKIESCLKSTSDNINSLNPSFTGLLGAGRVNAFNALRCVKPLTAYFSWDKSSVCPNQTIQFKDESFPLASSWRWSFPGGTPSSSTVQNPKVSYANEGKYQVSLIAGNHIGFDTIVLDSIIYVRTPKASLSGNTTIGAGGTAFLKFEFDGLPNYKVVYTNGLVVDSFIATSNPFYHPVKPTKTSTYKIVHFQDSNCVGTYIDSAVITIKETQNCSSASFQYTFGGLSDDEARQIVELPDGNFIIGGYTTNNSYGGSDILIIKLSAQGQVIWQKQIGGTSDDELWGLMIDDYGAIVGAGVTGADGIVFKLDPNGVIQWQRKIDGNKYEAVLDIKKTIDKQYVVIGNQKSSFSDTKPDMFIAKLDTAGTIIWNKIVIESSYQNARNLAVLSDGGYLLPTTYLNGSQFEHWLIKFDKNGNLDWAIEGGSSNSETVSSAKEIGGFIYAGDHYRVNSTNYEAFIGKYTLGGKLVWAKTIDGSSSERLRSIEPTKDGNILINVMSNTHTHGDWDGLKVLMDTSGNLISSSYIGGTKADRLDQMTESSDGSMIAVGVTESFGSGGKDVFIHKSNCEKESICNETANKVTVSSRSIVYTSKIPSLSTGISSTTINLGTKTSNLSKKVNCEFISVSSLSCKSIVKVQKISDTAGGFTGVLSNNSIFGYSTASIGDIDKDGVIDIVVASPSKNYGGGNKGSIWVLFMKKDGTVKSSQEIGQNIGGLSTALSNDELFGNSLSALGDFNKDGIPDVLVGSRSSDGGKFKGALWLLYLNSNGTVKSYSKISSTSGGLGSSSINGQAVFGSDCDTIGDLNKDGVMDIVVSAYRDNEGITEGGALWILFMNSNGTVKSIKKHHGGSSKLSGLIKAYDRFGLALASIGDLNGDQTNDLVVSAYNDDAGGSNRGALYTIKLKSNGDILGVKKLTSSDQLTFINSNNHLFTYDLSFVKKEDNIVKVLAANQLSDSGGVDKGSFYILEIDTAGNLNGHKEFHAKFPALSALKTNDLFGISADLYTQVGDTFKFIVGATGDDDGGSNRGAVYVLDLVDTCNQKCKGSDGKFTINIFSNGKKLTARRMIKSSDGSFIALIDDETSTYSSVYKTYFKESIVVKCSAEGDVIWSKKLNNTRGIGDEHINGLYSLIEDKIGNIYIGLSKDVNNTARKDYQIIKLDKNGKLLWAKENPNVGTNYANCFALKSNGNLISGGTIGYPGNGRAREYLSEMDSSGKILWSKSYYGKNLSSGFYHMYSIFENNNSFYSQGWITPYGGITGTVTIKKHDAQGNIKWLKYLPGQSDDYGVKLSQVGNDKLVYVGQIKSKGFGKGDVIVALFDTSGNEIWTKVFGTKEYDFGFDVTYANNLIYAFGRTNGFRNNSLSTICLVIDLSGNLINTVNYQSKDIIYQNCVISDSNGLYVLSTSNKENVLFKRLDFCAEGACSFDNVSLSDTSLKNAFTSFTYSEFSHNITLTNTNITSVPFTVQDTILCDNRKEEKCNLKAGINWLSGCASDSVLFLNTSVDSVMKQVYWEYNFGDGQTSIGIEHPKHLYKDTGSYKVRLIVGSSDSLFTCFDTIEDYIYVKPWLLVEASSNKDTICIGDTAVLEVEVQCGTKPYAYKWTPNSTLISDSTSKTYAIPTNTTQYIVTVTDSNGVIGIDTVLVVVNTACCKSFAHFEVKENPVCFGDTIQVIEDSKVAAGASFIWNLIPTAQWTNFNGKNIPPLVYSTPGRKSIQLIISDACGTDTAEQEVLIHELPNVDAGKDTVICMPDSVPLGTENLAGMYYWWKESGLVLDSSAGLTKTYLSLSDTLHLFVSDPFTGCSNMDSIIITDLKSGALDLGSDTSLCNGDSLRIGTFITGTYSWSTGASSQYISVKDSGTYILTLTQNGCSSSDTINVDLGDSLSFTLGGIDTLCYMDSILLKPNPQHIGIYLWDDNTTASERWVKDSGNYWLEIKKGNCTNRVEKRIERSTILPFSLGPDTTLCDNKKLSLGFIQAGKYNWSTGAKTNFIDVTVAGSYWLEISQGPCSWSDTIIIDKGSVNKPELGTDTLICDSPFTTLSITNWNSGQSYQWDDGSSLPNRTVNSSGTYSVRAFNGTCSAQDSVVVDFLSSPPKVEIGSDTILCEGELLYLDANVGNQYSYLWQDGSKEPTFDVKEEGRYFVSVSNACGSKWDSIDVTYINCYCNLYFPNAFTPNGDGLNDLFGPDPCNVQNYRLMIFNRWGEMMFDTKDINEKWDGTYQGKPVKQDAYMFVCEYQTYNGYFDEERVVSFSITLLR